MKRLHLSLDEHFNKFRGLKQPKLGEETPPRPRYYSPHCRPDLEEAMRIIEWVGRGIHPPADDQDPDDQDPKMLKKHPSSKYNSVTNFKRNDFHILQKCSYQ
ncbi:hypothetical protein GEMRC1_000622 [Eukaryota sp. GEM-RC1]